MDRRTRILSAFAPQWERLGDVAQRLGVLHGNSILTWARLFRSDGLVESRYWVGNLQWRLTAQGIEAREGQDAKRLDRNDESPVAESDAPKPNHIGETNDR